MESATPVSPTGTFAAAPSSVTTGAMDGPAGELDDKNRLRKIGMLGRNRAKSATPTALATKAMLRFHIGI